MCTPGEAQIASTVPRVYQGPQSLPSAAGLSAVDGK
jgi:hypothetical protein